VTMLEDFERIYATDKWGKGSGTGSSPRYCQRYLAYLADLLPHVRTVLDLGCGDWQLYSGFSWQGVEYTGVDIMKRLVVNNAVNHMTHTFIQADFSRPAVLRGLFDNAGFDLVLLKDVAQHWNDVEIHVWLQAMLELPFKTLLVTNNWRHFRSPQRNSEPRSIDNPYRWAPIDFRRYGFKDVLYYPRGKFKQVARLDHKQAPHAMHMLAAQDFL